MDKQFHIGEISRFFDLPASTLRYWEDAGILVPHKNTDNNYREYTVSDLMNLSDVIFYKNLGIPLKQIRTMEHSTPEEHDFLFNRKIEELNEQQRQIQYRIKKLHSRLTAIRTLEELKLHPWDCQVFCVSFKKKF